MKRIYTGNQKERTRQAVRVWRRNNPARRLLTNAKSRAKASGREFNIELSDIVIPTHCPVLGIKLNLDNRSKFAPDIPTLDRIKNNKGYVKGNVIVVSWRANNLKRDATLDELQRIVNFYRDF